MRNLVLLINNYWKQQTENNETQKMFFYWLKTVTSSSRFYINITHLTESETLITVMSELFFCEGFWLGHVIITTIIITFNALTFDHSSINEVRELAWHFLWLVYQFTCPLTYTKYTQGLLFTRYHALDFIFGPGLEFLWFTDLETKNVTKLALVQFDKNTW